MRTKVLLGIALFALSACATHPLPPPVSVDEALSMVKAGQTPDAIIMAMRESHSSYRLSASDIIRLHDAGLPTPVLDYMLQTELDETRGDQQMRDAEAMPPPHFVWGWRRW